MKTCSKCIAQNPDSAKKCEQCNAELSDSGTSKNISAPRTMADESAPKKTAYKFTLSISECRSLNVVAALVLVVGLLAAAATAWAIWVSFDAADALTRYSFNRTPILEKLLFSGIAAAGVVIVTIAVYKVINFISLMGAQIVHIQEALLDQNEGVRAGK